MTRIVRELCTLLHIINHTVIIWKRQKMKYFKIQKQQPQDLGKKVPDTVGNILQVESVKVTDKNQYLFMMHD